MRSIRLRSLLVGLSSASIDFLLFTLCTLIWAGGWALLMARWLCAASSAVLNFLGNRSWAFGATRGRATRQGFRFAVAAGTGICLTTGLWWLLFYTLAWDPRALHLLSLALVWALFSFPVLRGWVFRSRPSHLEPV